MHVRFRLLLAISCLLLILQPCLSLYSVSRTQLLYMGGAVISILFGKYIFKKYYAQHSPVLTASISNTHLNQVNQELQPYLKFTPEQVIGPIHNNYVRTPVPIVLASGNHVTQVSVLWQMLPYASFIERNIDLANAYSESTGLKVNKYLDYMYTSSSDNSFLRTQLKPPVDFNPQTFIAGGPESCGYQALKNSYCILHALDAGSNREQFTTSMSKLHDLTFAAQLFGKEDQLLGRWREFVVTLYRQRALVRWYLERELNLSNRYLIPEEKLEQVPTHDGIRPTRIYAIYRTILAQVQQNIVTSALSFIFANTAGQPEEQTVVYSVECTSGDIIRAIKNYTAFLAAEPGEYSDINQVIKRDDIIQQYINLDYPAMQIKYTTDQLTSLCREYQAFRQAQRSQGKYVPAEISLTGENLNSEELAGLITAEKRENGLLAPFADVTFSVIEDELILEHTIKEYAEYIQKNSGNYRHVFLVYGDGHWLTVVLNKYNKHINYIIADSLNLPRYGAPYVYSDNEAYNTNLVASELTQRVQKIIAESENYFCATDTTSTNGEHNIIVK